MRVHGQLRLRALLVGFYAWMAAASFGLTALDVVYAGAIRGALGPGSVAVVFNEPADFLLAFGALAMAAGVAALALTWQSPLVRNLLAASAVLTVLMPLAPVLLQPLVEAAGAGARLRLLGAAAVSLTAFLAFGKLGASDRDAPPPVTAHPQPHAF
jgi:hypothetical protein